jgi:multiple sugar transport system permease protein
MEWRRVRGKALTYVFLIVVLLFVITPFFWMVVTSLKTEPEALKSPPTWLPKNLTFDAGYVGIWTRKNFGVFFLNSIIVSLSTAVCSTLVGSLAGYGFSRFKFRGRTFLMGVFLASQMLPGVLLVGPYFKMLCRLGLYNSRFGLIVALTTITLPFSTWMLKGFLDTVPRELDEAALVDGCGRLRTFLRVVMPVITPGMVATIIFAFLLAWGDLLWALVLMSTDNMTTVTLGLSRLVTEFRIIWPMMMAGSVIATIPPLLLYLLLQKYLIQGLTRGAVKA